MNFIFRNFSASIKPNLARLFIVILLFGVALAQVPVQNAQAAPGEATLILTKTIDGDITTAEVGDTIFYRLRFACSSLTNDCGELVITDVLPTNPNPPFSPLFTYVPADSDVPAGFTMVEAPAGTITITKDDNLLLDGSQYDAVIAVRVNYGARPLPASITNQAVGLILPPGEPLWELPVTATAPPITIDGVTADWNLTKTLFSPSINPTVDTDVTYQVQLCPGTTSGNVALTNIQITDTLPVNAVFVGASNGGTELAGVVTWNVAGPITPPNCVTRYVTVRYPSTLFESSSPPDNGLIDNVTNTATYTADYAPSSGTCVSPCLNDTVPINHDIIDIVEGPTYNKDDVGDPVGWVGTARFTLELDTNGTNYPSNAVTLFDTLPAQLQVTGVTSGTWASDHVRVTIEYATDYDGTPNWTAFPVQPVEYNDNDLYNTGLPTNITRIRWVFEYDSDPNDLNGDGNLAPLPGLPYDWTFSNSPEIRVTPRHTATTASDGISMPAAVVGATYTNCLQMSRINSGGTPVTGACNNETMTVQGDFVSLRTTKAETPGGSYDPVDDPLINTFTADGSILPNDTLRYILTVDVTERSSADLVNPTIRDTMPPELIFVRNGTAQLDGADLPPAQQPTFTQAGQILTWAWNNPNPSLTVSPLALGSHYLTVSFYARVPRGTPPGDLYTNNLYVTTDSVDLYCEITGTHQTDDGDIDGDLNSAEDACKNTDTFRVERSAALRGEKWIRSVHVDNSQVVRFNTFAPDPACPVGGTAGLPGSANPFTRYPCISQAYPEGALGVTQYVSPPPGDPTLDDYEYNLRIFNEGNVPMLEYILYDILPYSGDKGSGGTLVNSPRNSEFRPMLRGPVAFISGTGVAAGNFIIEYSQSTNPCRPEVFDSVNPNTPAGCIDDWTAVAPADWSTVRAYRIELVSGSIPQAVPAGQEPRFGVPMFIPKDSLPLGVFNDDDAQSREIAWNSFSHVGAYDRDPDPAIQIQDLLASEPRKVGITIPERFSIGNRVWRNSDNSGTINAPDDANPGIAGVVVNLYDAADTSTPIATTTTDSGGYYLFSNLPFPGNYVVGIPATNFDNVGDPLYTLHSSTGTPSSATYTNPPETNPDSSDHGIDTVAPPLPSTEVFSRSIPLAHATELTAESDLSGNDRDGPAGTRRGLNGERDDNSDLTVDFGFFGGTDVPFSIGNHVWKDDGTGGGILNDGIRQAGELPVAGARVDLYRDGNLDGVLSPAELIRWDITDLEGFYLFDNLDPGSYYVSVSAGNFTNSFDPDGAGPLPSAPGVLRGWYNSQPTGTENVGVAGNPNIPNADSDDNGVNTDYPESQGVRSGVIVLQRGVNETLGESHLSSDSSIASGFNPTAGDGTGHIGRFGETDATSNTTIDFGFIPPMSLGNRVWIDERSGNPAGYNNGTMDVDLLNPTDPILSELGKGGVRVELWRDVNGNGDLDSGEFIRFTTTDAKGYYLFDRVQPGGNYYVHIPASNFASGAPLENYISSYDLNQTTAPADDTEDRDDNGVDSATPATDGITSPLIVMAYTTEPQTPGNETDISSDTATYGVGNVGLLGQTDTNSNLTMDFGFVRPPRSIGNYLWFDLGGGAGGVVNDGIRNGTEGPVANARVSLYLDADTNSQPDDLGVVGNRTDDWIGWDVTDANGYYLFDNLPPNNYIVGVDRDNFDNTGVGDTYISLFGYTSSTSNVDNASNDLDSRDNGVDRPSLTDATFSPHGVLSNTINLTANPITLPSGETGSGNTTATLGNNPTAGDGANSRGRYGETDANSDLTIDFGFVEAYSIGNRVWFDTNNNAIMDAGEVGVDGVQVEIYRAAITLPTGSVIDTQVTTNGGYYLFDHLPPGNYVVVVTADNFNTTGTYNALVGYWSSLTYRNPLNNGNIDETPAPDPDNNTDASSVVGFGDENGLRRTIGGAPFQNAVLALPVTVGSTGLTEPMGEIDLDATLPGSRQGQPDGRGNMTVDFGFYRTEIGNLVYEDVNLNGTYNAGTDNLMNGARVRLFQQDNTTEVRVGADGILGTADDSFGVNAGVLTGSNGWANGEYHFSGLPAGDYIVRVTTIPAATYPNMISTIDNGSAAMQSDNDMPDWNLDDNDNGDGQGVVTVTSETDNPDVPANDRLTMTPSGGSRPDATAKTNIAVTNSTGTTIDNTVDFGFVKSYSLGNRVWYDTNNNGVRDAAEVGINGVRVELYRDTDGNGSYTPGTDTFIGFTTTTANSGANGYYRFDNLFPGDYIVVVPASNFATGNPLRSYWSTGTTINGSGAVSESATNDPDNNFDASAVIASSDDNGATTFSGNTINYVASTAITLGGEIEPTTDDDPVATSQANEAPDNRSNRTVDFGFYREEIGNLVFSDNDVSGHFNTGDTTISGALVHLFASNGTTEIITGADGIPGTADDGFGPDGVAGGGDDGIGGIRTNGTGNYLFSGLSQGDYIVKVDSPAGMVSTIDTNPQADNDNPNTNTDNNDNGDGLTGGIVTFDVGDSLTMNPGVDALKPNRTVTNASGTTTDPTIDFGFVSLMGIGNRVWIDDGTGNFANANNGRLDAGEVGVNNVTVQLFSTGPDGVMGGSDDYQVGSDTITVSIGANAGYYQFDNLYPARYYVRIPASEFNAGGDLVGYTSSFGNGGLNDDDDQSGASGDENGIDSSNLPANGIVTPVYTLMPNTEPTTDEHPGIYTGTLGNNNVNFTADFGFFYPFSIGNRVFRDDGTGGGTLNSGIMNGAEPPIANVRVELYRDTNGTPGLQVGSDSLLRFDITDAGGYYLFDGLIPGEYYIHIPASNFTGAGAPLLGLYNSTPTGTEVAGVAGNPYTPNTDRDDNGVNNARPDLNGVSSGPIVLSIGNEPAGEIELSSDTGTVAGNNPTVDDGPSSRGRNGESDNDSNLTIDFGFIPPLSLGNRVWIDNGSTATGPILSQYNDALMNGNEPGRGSVLLNLYYDADNDGNYTGSETMPYATTLTDATGYYLFDNLPPGRFYVQVAPSNFASGGALEGFASSTGQSLSEILDVNDNGVDDVNYLTNGISSVNFILNHGFQPINESDLNTTGTYGPNNVGNFGQINADSNLTLDFGFVSPPRSLGNRLWFDDDNDGLMDGGEAPFVGARVSLYSDSNNDGVPDGAALATDITDSVTTPSTGGYYLFDNLPSGRYLVGVDTTNFQSGQPLFEYASSTGNQTSGTDVNDNGIDRILPGDAAASPYGVLSNNVDLTVNAPTGETDLSGNPTDGPQSRGTNGETDVNSDLTIDFGFHRPMSIGNRVWRDDGGTTGIMNNGIMDGDEEPILGVRVELYRDTDGTAGLNIATDTFVGHDVTDAGGYYLFDDLAPDNYFAHISEAQFDSGGPLFGLNNSSPDGAEDTPVTGNDLVHSPITDSDDNGVYNTRPDLNGISSGVIVLTLATEPQNEIELSGQTNPGAPSNAANNPTGWDGPNSRGRFGEADNNSNLTVDFGFLPVYSLGNRVWYDTGVGAGGVPTDGIINGTEPGASGRTVNLYLDANDDGTPDDINIIGNPNDDILATDTTDANGYYRFDNLITGTYIVEVIPPAGYGSTTDFTLDADDNVDNDDNGVIILPTGEVRSHPITLGGALEPTTDNDAAPNPNLADGEAPNNQSNRTVDFGLIGSVAIGNVVWYDTGAGAAYNNGIFDVGETSVNGVTVNLYYDADNDGSFTGSELTPYLTTTTAFNAAAGIDGFYQFDRIIPGRYYVGIPNTEFLDTEELVGYTSSTDDIPATTDQTIDDNADENGRDATSTFLAASGIRTIDYILDIGTMPTTDNETSYTGTIADDSINFTADFGFTQVVAIGNRVWFDNGAGVGQANNGRQDAGELGVSNVTVELYQSGATPGVTTPIATTTTNGSGDYVFDGLMPGSYFVHIPAAEFQTGGDLFSYSSSSGQGLNETDDQSFDENGSDSEPSVNGVSSPVYNLSLNGEPVASDDETSYPGVLDDNDVNYTADFGFVQLVAIGNVVWLDTGAGAAYNNGAFDAGETGVDGVTVNLYTSTGTFVGTTTTSGGGYYEFDNLFPGTYYIAIPNTEFLPGGDLVGYISSTDSVPATTDQILDDDIDENGQDNNTLLSTGIHTMPYILTAGSLPTTSDNETSYNGNLDDNSVNFTADLGFTEAYSLGNRVWFDADKDGTRNGAEVGLPNIPVTLYRDSDNNGTPDDGSIASMFTDTNGFYRFDNLIADTYIVEVVPPLGYASTVDAGDADTDTDDDDDNGVNFIGSNVRSEPVTLGRGNSEPVAETNPVLNPDTANGEAPDARSNRTVDFGFIVSDATSDKQLTDTIIMDTDPSTGNPIAGTNFTPETPATSRPVAIGEILTYQASLRVPSGSTFISLVAVDQLDAGLAFVGCDSVSAPNLTTTMGNFADACSPDINPTVTPQSTPESPTDATQITFSLGDVTNSTADTQTLTITYRVIVLDVAGNRNHLSGLNNSIAWSWGGTNLTPIHANPVEVVEPELSIDKQASPKSSEYGNNIRFTLMVGHTSASSTDAFDVVATDILPAGLRYVPGSAQFSGLAPKVPTPPADYYDPAASTLTFKWDVFPLAQTTTITFLATFVGPAPVTNRANVAWTSLPIDPQPSGQPVRLSPYNNFSTERWYDPTDLNRINTYSRGDSVAITLPEDVGEGNPSRLPATGFAPGVITKLPAMPAGFAYAQTDILLEIPKLKQTMTIAGVPYNKEILEWNLTWLNTEAGWLENTAYPTHAGNSALTAHVTLPNGQPGPFAKLDTLSYGDQVIVLLEGQKYIFEVRDNKQVKPDLVKSTLKHEEYPWLTLITCKSYNEKTGDYTYRTVVRAVLVKVVDE